MYWVDRGSTFSGVPIQRRKVPERDMPMTVRRTPLSRAIGRAVCTVLCTTVYSRLPSAWATVTPAPTDRPMKKFTIRLVMEPVAPTAATLILPQNLPTIIRSAALNNSCRRLVRMMGMVYRIILGRSGPVVMLVFKRFKKKPSFRKWKQQTDTATQ